MSKGGFRPNSGRKKGSIPWNKGIPMKESSKLKVSESKKGTPAWNKGIPMSAETKLKLSLSKKGQPSYWKGKKFPEEMRRKMSLSSMGRISPNKGKKLSASHIEKLRQSHLGKSKTDLENLKNREGQYKRYLKLNPDYVVATRNKRIALNGGFHSLFEWKNLKKEYNLTCPCCKKSEPEIILTRDHIVPLLMGGSNYIKNIQPLCHQCNCKKHTQTIKY